MVAKATTGGRLENSANAKRGGRAQREALRERNRERAVQGLRYFLSALGTDDSPTVPKQDSPRPLTLLRYHRSPCSVATIFAHTKIATVLTNHGSGKTHHTSIAPLSHPSPLPPNPAGERSAPARPLATPPPNARPRPPGRRRVPKNHSLCCELLTASHQ